MTDFDEEGIKGRILDWLLPLFGTDPEKPEDHDGAVVSPWPSVIVVRSHGRSAKALDSIAIPDMIDESTVAKMVLRISTRVKRDLEVRGRGGVYEVVALDDAAPEPEVLDQLTLTVREEVREEARPQRQAPLAEHGPSRDEVVVRLLDSNKALTDLLVRSILGPVETLVSQTLRLEALLTKAEARAESGGKRCEEEDSAAVVRRALAKVAPDLPAVIGGLESPAEVAVSPLAEPSLRSPATSGEMASSADESPTDTQPTRSSDETSVPTGASREAPSILSPDQLQKLADILNALRSAGLAPYAEGDTPLPTNSSVPDGEPGAAP